MALLRLYTLSPARVARAAALELRRGLGPQLKAAGLAATRGVAAENTLVYQRVEALTAYAVGAAGYRGDVVTAVRWLEETLRMQLPGEPRTELETALLGALARAQLDAGVALSAAELALLAGRDRDSILAQADDIPGAYRSRENRHRPWRFKVSARLTSWLLARQEQRVA